LVAAVPLLTAACSGSGSGGSAVAAVGTSTTDTRATCALIQHLQHTADGLAAAPLADPARANAALRAAVADYTRTLDEIAARVPSALRLKVEVLRAAVQQYKFADALAARAPLDSWAADHC
jgi:hypothetical protein